MRKNTLKAIYTLPVLLSPSIVFAQDAPPQLSQIGGILDNVFGLILPIGGLLAVAMIVMGGYMWIMAAGDPQKLKAAQGTLTWAIIGLVFLFIFRMILVMVFDFLGS